MTKKLILNRPNAILLDIEGTISDLKFVSNILIPYTKNNLKKYFYEMFESNECQEMIDRLRETRKYYPDYPIIYPSTSNRNLIIKSIIDYTIKHLQQRNRLSEIKQLQLLLWLYGYENNQLCGHVYDEVTTILHQWKFIQKCKIYLFSSAMISAQQLLLCYTNHGNCLPLIDDFFDSSIGDKCDQQSYINISNEINELPMKILFITDNDKEAKAALNANYNVCLIQRLVNQSVINKKIDNTLGIPIINSLDEIKFS